MAIETKEMRERIQYEVARNNQVVEEVHKKNDTIKWIAWTVSASVILILGGFYFMAESKADILSRKTPMVVVMEKEKSENNVKKPSFSKDYVSSKSSVQWGKSSDSPIGTFSREQTPVNLSWVFSWSPDARYTHVWGSENTESMNDGGLKVFFPKDSYSPSSSSDSTPKGGAGFIYKIDEKVERARLSYSVKFEKWFDFVNGGKFWFGFCSGECPRWWAEVGKDFSTRFMWRKNGDAEVYAYIPDKTEVYGKSLGRWFFRFETDTYYNIDLDIMLNTPGQENGIIVVFIDGKEVFRDTTIKFRETAETKIDSIISAQFFGGSTSKYAATKDERLYLKGLKYTY